MRIAQVAPLYESVPPKGYGGTERVVSYLTEELVRQGHKVTLFASGDSETRASLVPVCPHSLRLDPGSVLHLPHHFLMIELLAARAHEFDAIHFHIDYLHFSVSRRLPTPSVTTLHGRLDLPDLAPLYREFQDMPVVSISDAQRVPLPEASFWGTVYHGLPHDLYELNPGTGGYFAFVGRISPEKRVDRAIEIATRLGVPLKIAAKIDPSDRAYFEQHVKHLFDNPLVEYLGELGDADKSAFLGNARALLFPIDWPEPFGLVMIEAMACGTPVVAFRAGSVTEVIDENVTGVVVDDMEGAVAAACRIGQLDRRACRRMFELRFGVERMARDYLAIYSRLMTGDGPVRQRMTSGVAA
jgi:glycosyltransferase involved in cell wall biosynthesis